ncbi:MAG: LptF/LptG family permease [Deltaproteobacteria bacterium]|nr:LptF/LptG family permease [Deltaproteobacteria bacterium]
MLVARPIAAYAAIGFVAFGGVFVLQNLLRQLEDLLGLGVKVVDALALFGTVALFLAGYVLPIALLFGVLAALGQLAASNEVKALRAHGVSLAQLAAPVFALALAVSFATWRLLGDEEPEARRRLVEIAANVAGRGGLIQPGELSPLDRDGARLVLVDGRDANGRLSGVFISDRTDPARPFVVTAREGEFGLDAQTRTAHLRLREGEIQLESPQVDRARTQRIAFHGLDYAFDVDTVKALSKQLRPREMSERELRDALAHVARTGASPPGTKRASAAEYEIQLHRRLALPLAPLVLAALAIPLALGQARAGRSRGALLCALTTVAYYVALSGAEYLAKKSLAPAALALWLPNALFGAAALALLWRARRGDA